LNKIKLILGVMSFFAGMGSYFVVELKGIAPFLIGFGLVVMVVATNE